MPTCCPPRARSLYQSKALSVHDYRCFAHKGGAGGEECANSASIVFVRRGLFVRHVEGQTLAADANCVAFFSPGQTYRVSHPVEGGDDCTAFVPSPELLDEMLDFHGMRDCEGGFPSPQGEISSHAYAAQRRLLRRLAAADSAGAEIDEAAIALLDAVLLEQSRRNGRAARGSSRRQSTIRAHRETVEYAKVYMAARSGERVTLDEVASASHCSPYHLTRVFHEVTGAPVRRYLSRLRLRSALDRIAQGERDITRIALDSGFFDHSHFTNAFRREFGAPPSAFRDAHDRRSLRQMSKNLQV